MKDKAFLMVYGGICLCLVLLYTSMIYLLDPLGYYKVIEKSQYYAMNARYQLPSFVKNLDYSTIVIGPSMSLNFDEKVMDQQFHTKSYNAALSAASAREQRYIAELAIDTHPNLNQLFWEINFDSLSGDTDRVNEEAGGFPAYFYTTNPVDDIQYLFSYYPLQEYQKRRETPEETKYKTPYELYKFGRYVKSMTPDKITDKTVKNNQNPAPEPVSFQKMKENFDENIWPIIAEHPDKNFILYYTPYPITYHIFNYNRSSLAFIDRLEMKEYVFQKLKDYPHVKLYDFQTRQDITFNMENYVDGSHYYQSINHEMMSYMSQHSPIQNQDEIKNNNTALLEQVEHYRFEQLRF